MSEAGKVLLSFAQLAQVKRCADFLVEMGVLRPEDSAKAVRVYVKKHPEINAALQRMDQTPPPKDHNT